MGPLGNIIQKELMEMFRDPKLLLGMVLVPIIMFPMMGLAISSSMEATENAMKTSGVSLYSLDDSDGNGTYATALHTFLGLNNLTVKNLTASDTADAVRKATEGGATVLISVPANFTENK